MKKKIIFIMLIVILLLMTVACSKKTTDKETKENVTTEITTEEKMTTVKDDFESQAITAILECSHVIDNMEANRLSEVSIEIMNKSVDGYSAEVTCIVIYSNEYVEMQERLICILEEWSEGWVVEEVEIDSELEYTKQAKVYYLNFRPEQHETWQYLAKEYSNETGIEVTVETVSGGDYETTLQSEIEKKGAPTLFQVNGPVGLNNWKDYCYDLTDAKVTKELTSDAFALKADGKVYGIGYVIESYGIIVNKTLLKEAGYELSDIASFDDLKKVAEDITANSDDLGFAAFSSAGMDGSSDWRFKTHLANLPIYFEYKADGINNTDAIKGDYLDNYRDIFDLYINNSTCEGNELSVKTYEDSINEFLDGRAVFYQNGSWMYSIISEVYLDNELAMIPIYIGAGDEAKQGLCTGTENYWCVNKNADEADIKATLDFMYWCVTSEKGTKTMANDMGFVIPYKKAVEPSNIFVKQDLDYTAEGKSPVTWTFSTMPSEMWKNNVGSALTVYAAEPTDSNWKAVEEAFVNGWKEEYNSNNF